MHYFKRFIYSVILIISCGAVAGQQVPVFSQYIMNGYLVNPSLAGLDGYSTVSLTARDQWLGVVDGPRTYEASYQTSLQKDNFSRSKRGRKRASKPSGPAKVGLGAILFSDNNGIIRRTGFQADYAYHIQVGNSRIYQNDLSFGLGLVTYQYALSTKDLKYSYDDDPYLSEFDKSVFITDFNFGACYSSSKYYVGFSMTNLLRGSLIYGNSVDNKRGEQGHYFLTGGFDIPIDKNWSIKPSAFIRASDLVLKSTQLDLTGRIFYKDSYWAGLSYRTNDAIIVMLGLKYEQFYFGYAFDFALTDIRKESLGSMELTLAYKFGEGNRKYRWLNSF